MTENEDLIIRPFSGGDAGSISSLIIENLLTVNAKGYSESAMQKLATLYSPAHIKKYARDGEMFVSAAGADLVGTVTLEAERVRNLFVRVNRQNQGVGERLMRFIEDRARHKGLEKLSLQADLTAVEFYSKLGYARCGERLLLIRSARIRMVAMEKDISK